MGCPFPSILRSSQVYEIGSGDKAVLAPSKKADERCRLGQPAGAVVEG